MNHPKHSDEKGHDSHAANPTTADEHHQHSGSAMGGHEMAGKKAHDKHEGHNVAMFQRKFWIALALTVPALTWGHMLPTMLRYAPPPLPGTSSLPYSEEDKRRHFSAVGIRSITSLRRNLDVGEHDCCRDQYTTAQEGVALAATPRLNHLRCAFVPARPRDRKQKSAVFQRLHVVKYPAVQREQTPWTKIKRPS